MTVKRVYTVIAGQYGRTVALFSDIKDAAEHIDNAHEGSSDYSVRTMYLDEHIPSQRTSEPTPKGSEQKGPEPQYMYLIMPHNRVGVCAVFDNAEMAFGWVQSCQDKYHVARVCVNEVTYAITYALVPIQEDGTKQWKTVHGSFPAADDDGTEQK